MRIDDLRSSRRYLSNVGVWPSPRQLDVDGWLDNFEEGTDRSLAAALLDSYVHLNEEQIVHAVASTIRSLSGLPRFGSGYERRKSWGIFLDQAYVSFPLSRVGDPTGSGYIFARIASEKLGFLESQIYAPEHLVSALSETQQGADLILLDDITASGTQFVRSWKRKFDTDHGRIGLDDLASAGKIRSAHYLPVVATSEAKQKIESKTSVRVIPTYTLTEDYRCLSENTRLIPEKYLSEVEGFLGKYSPRTGKDEYGPTGYGGLGLAISFHHGCPNNTLPILQWGQARNDWKPLVS